MRPTNKYNLEAMARQIKTIVAAAEELKRLSGGIPAIDKNADAILAFTYILESSVSDIPELDT